MELDFKTAFKAATVPALAMIAASIILFMLAFFGLDIGIISLPMQFAILCYAGYNGVKAFKLDLANGALTGAIASLLSMIFTIILNITLSVIGVIPVLDASAQIGMPSEAFMAVMFIGYAIGLFFSPVIGAVFGAIGAHFARKK